MGLWKWQRTVLHWGISVSPTVWTWQTKLSSVLPATAGIWSLWSVQGYIISLMLAFRFMKLKQRARAASESSSKRGSFDRITNCQEFWNIEMGHLTYEMESSWGGFELKKVLLDIKHMTFQTYHSESHSENHLKSQFVILKAIWKSFEKSCKYLSFGLWAEWEWKSSFHQLLKVVGGGWVVGALRLKRQLCSFCFWIETLRVEEIWAEMSRSRA